MPSSEAPVPRERQSAWQRWELAALPGSAIGAPAPAPPAIDADALARERAAAVEAGRAAGYAEGRAAAKDEQARIARIVAALGQSLADHEQRLVDEVLDLALLLARQMVGEGLAVRRELLLPVVRAALRQLPQASQRIDIELNPADIAVVQQCLGAEPLGERCHLSANPAIQAGGCRVETEQCEIDATVASRWKRLLGSLGRSDDWLEPL